MIIFIRFYVLNTKCLLQSFSFFSFSCVIVIFICLFNHIEHGWVPSNRRVNMLYFVQHWWFAYVVKRPVRYCLSSLNSNIWQCTQKILTYWFILYHLICQLIEAVKYNVISIHFTCYFSTCLTDYLYSIKWLFITEYQFMHPVAFSSLNWVSLDISFG